jgi:hypothetical protein
VRESRVFKKLSAFSSQLSAKKASGYYRLKGVLKPLAYGL